MATPRPGYVDAKPDLLVRLRRIEGQVRGLQRLIESDTYCIDVLAQLGAATKALESVAIAMLGDHLRHCVHDAILEGADGAEEKITEANRAIARLVRS